MQEGEQPKQEAKREPLPGDVNAPTPEELGAAEGGVVSQQDAAKRLEQALSESGAVQDVTLLKQKEPSKNVREVLADTPRASTVSPATVQPGLSQPMTPLNGTSRRPLSQAEPSSAAPVPPVAPRPVSPNATPRVAQTTQPELVPLRKAGVPEPAPREAASAATPAQPSSDDLVQRLRTYKNDAAQAMQRQHASVTSVAAAQAQARVGLQPEAPADDSWRTWKNVAVASLTVILLLGGIGIAAWAYLATQEDPETPRAALPRPFFFADADQKFSLVDTEPSSLRQTLRSSIDTIGLSLGSIQHMYFTETETLPDGTVAETIAPSASFLNAIGARVESPFVRSLNADFMFGGHVFDGNQPFLIFRTGTYEQAFAGMLAWERTMSEDLAPIFGPPVAPVQTGTSTPFTTKPFSDEVIRNQDARVLRDETGEIAILYTFPTRSMVIVTTNEHTLIEIMTRMANAREL